MVPWASKQFSTGKIFFVEFARSVAVLMSLSSNPRGGGHPHTPGHHGWLRHPTPSHHRGLEHPTPSHHLIKINVSPAPGFATKLTLFSQTRKPCEQTGNIFIKTFFRIHKLCDEKHGIELRTDNRFDSKSTYVDI